MIVREERCQLIVIHSARKVTLVCEMIFIFSFISWVYSWMLFSHFWLQTFSLLHRCLIYTCITHVVFEKIFWSPLYLEVSSRKVPGLIYELSSLDTKKGGRKKNSPCRNTDPLFLFHVTWLFFIFHWTSKGSRSFYITASYCYVNV